MGPVPEVTEPASRSAERNAGAGFVVGVLTGGGTAAELGRSRHTHLLESAARLPELL
ncbi:hypothetical protein [Actinomadura fibrosa]|uniref:hypothetical protein n=1 Tax=Actinomadura fibrosa TaxID=111802 RepID=UPI001A9555D7|nr:hypothetical protein [Actinomadura fibrosa]